MSEEEIINSIENVLKYESEIDNAPFKIEAIQGLLDLYNKEKALAENHRIAFEKQTENLHEIEYLYNKEKEKNKQWEDKIKEKIKELDETKQYWNTEIIDILQELLEEKEI